jgi:hypothetical protein
MVIRMADAIKHRVAQMNVWRRHINDRTQRLRPIRKLPGTHPREKIEIFLAKLRGRKTV